MQLFEIKKFFGKNYFSTCQHCGERIYKRNRNGSGESGKSGKHAWFAYSKAAYKDDADYEVLCKDCYDKAVKKYGEMISRDEMLRRIDRIADRSVITVKELNQALFGQCR